MVPLAGLQVNTIVFKFKFKFANLHARKYRLAVNLFSSCALHGSNTER